MNKPHKWAAVIKAWADGARIQYRDIEDGEWFDLDPKKNPTWCIDFQYRVKPELKDPGIVCRDAFYSAIYPGHEPKSVHSREWTAAAKAVIEAYKAGELKDF